MKLTCQSKHSKIYKVTWKESKAIASSTALDDQLIDFMRLDDLRACNNLVGSSFKTMF